jgi:2-polyprenyl-6-methoxyphenol hydroxylase-like FAD-dependent oxidoreductase
VRSVVIIGAGHAGLQLGIGLLRHGYAVRIVTARSPDLIRAGTVMSSQLMFGDALQAERNTMLNFWDEICPAYSRRTHHL